MTNTRGGPVYAAPVTIRKITLWRREVDSRPGALAEVLEPFTTTGADLQVIMRYRHPTNNTRAIIEVCPQEAEASGEAVREAGLKASYVPALLIEGDYVPGFGSNIAKVIEDLEAKIMFLVAQTLNGKYTVTIGFEAEDDAEKVALSLLLTKIEVQGDATEIVASGS
jgi:hypothetical protein